MMVCVAFVVVASHFVTSIVAAYQSTVLDAQNDACARNSHDNLVPDNEAALLILMQVPGVVREKL